MTAFLRKGSVDVAAFLDTAFQIRLVEVGELASCVSYRASQLIVVARESGECSVADGGAADRGYFGADW